MGLAIAAAPDRPAIAQAVQALEAGHDQAAAAAYVLQGGGRPAAQALRDAWPSLSELARRRAIGPLARLARSHPAAVDALVEAARSEDEALQRQAFAALEQAAPRGCDGLVALLDDPRVGDRAALSLARTDPALAIEPLLAAMASRGGEDRAALRAALSIAARRAPGSAQTLAAWRMTGPPPPALASAALGLSAFDFDTEVVAQLVEQALGNASDFNTRWRLLRSAGPAGASERIDRWLGAELRGASEWMLRDAALEALAARGHRDRARGALADPYPRVRARAAMVLSGDASTTLERAKLARQDPWPMVRVAAVESLTDEEEALPVLVAAVDDAMSAVRAAAIGALTKRREPQGWDRIHARLDDPGEWPNVTAAAIAYVLAHCRADAVDSLLRVVRRASRSNSGTDELNNAARAIEALRALGTPEAERAIGQLARTEGVPPTLKIPLARPLPEGARCGSRVP
jgi:hypothetical protein